MPDQGGHALIVEDELLAALGLQTMLAELGYSSFSFAGTARQALEQARARTPHLVTVDLGLLDGDGFQAVDAIFEACGPVPLVFVTGDAAAATERTDAVVLEKPVFPLNLARAVSRALGMVEPADRDGGDGDRHGTVIQDR